MFGGIIVLSDDNGDIWYTGPERCDNSVTNVPKCAINGFEIIGKLASDGGALPKQTADQCQDACFRYANCAYWNFQKSDKQNVINFFYVFD